MGKVEASFGLLLNRLHIPYITDVLVGFEFQYWACQMDLVTLYNKYGYPIDFEMDDTCVMPDQVIYTKPLKSAKNTAPGDTIVLHDGQDGIIKNKWIKKYTGRMITIRPSCLPPIIVTPNHRLLIGRLASGGRMYRLRKRDFEYRWVPAEEIRRGDYLLFPIIKDTFQTMEQKLNIRRGAKTPPSITIDEDIAWLLGIYTAEGSYSPNSKLVCFSFNINEGEIERKVATIIKARFDLSGFVSKNPITHSRTIRFHSPILGEWLSSNCGSGAKNKVVPSVLFSSPFPNRASYVRGLIDGDGWKIQYKTRRRTVPGKIRGVALGTSSRDLSNGLYFLLSTMGIFPSVASRIMKGHIYKDKLFKPYTLYTTQIYGHYAKALGFDNVSTYLSHHRSFSANGFYHLYIRCVEDTLYDGEVIDIETNDGTYLMPMISHNSHETRRRNRKDEARDKGLITSTEWVIKRPYIEQLPPLPRPPWIIFRLPYRILNRCVAVQGSTITFKYKRNRSIIEEVSDLIKEAYNSKKPRRILWGE